MLEVVKEHMKAVLLVLVGLIVIAGYAAGMVFGVEAVFWLAMAIFPLCVFNLFWWSSPKGCA
ncbi:hypothetical protein [Aestuariispira insulae]|uniref:Uncharacterized protein n=1 Tax=Aestuariispira insulae TaxID=1461337 RepID=A0A3D9HR83_9PROT|nr:hypothetical protein [Aestuariispira insulae]RED51396.1 hypothetical protein DFP90_103196 [Aestuariispira insulae]